MAIISAHRDICILGVDPGTAALGLGVVVHSGGRLEPIWYGCLRTTPKESMPRRLARIHQACVDVIERFQPDAMAIEELYFGASARAALAVGQARGTCILAAAQAGIDVHEYSPATIKQAVTGYGRAEKDQVQRMVQATLHMTELPRPDHAADALAVAVCHIGAHGLALRW